MMRMVALGSIVGLLVGLVSVLPAEASELEGVEIVAWTGYVGELEWGNLHAILSEAGATIVETDTRSPAELSVLLRDVGFLLFPEQAAAWMEEVDLVPIGEQLAPALRAFLNDGGRIVALTWAVGGEDILRGAGLSTAADERDVTGQGLMVVAPDDALVVGVPDEFLAPEFSTDFSNVDPDATDIVTTEDFAPVVFRLYRQGGELVLLGFDFLEPVEATERLVVNAFLPDSPPCIGLIPGEVVEGLLEPGARWDEEQYGLTLHPDGQYMLVELAGVVDLHLRRGEPVEFVDGVAVADLTLLASQEQVAILSVDMLGSNEVCMALANPSAEAQPYRLAVWAVPDLEVVDEFPFTTTDELGPTSLAALNRFVKTSDGYLALAQYRVHVSEGNERLTLTVHGEDIRAYIQHGAAISVVAGKVVADVAFTNSVELSGPFLIPGVYFLAIEGQAPPQEYTVDVELE